MRVGTGVRASLGVSACRGTWAIHSPRCEAWRVQATEKEIIRRNEPDKSKAVVLKHTDETETAVDRVPQRVNGIAVRYIEREEVAVDITDGDDI